MTMLNQACFVYGGTSSFDPLSQTFLAGCCLSLLAFGETKKAVNVWSKVMKLGKGKDMQKKRTKFLIIPRFSNLLSRF